MTQLHVEQIDEFKVAGWCPDEAVDAVVDQIRDMHEEEELETLLKRVVNEADETPHGPTEIGDTLTTVHVEGEPQSAAFVLKGKSFEKVKVDHVAHQIDKTSRVPDLDVVALGAVGHIQDEAVENLATKSEDRGFDYLILRARDLAKIFLAHHLICPDCGEVLEQEAECPSCSRDIDWTELRFSVPETAEYERLDTNDSSVPDATRWSIDIKVDKHYPPSVVRLLIEKAMSDVREEFGADVVYVYAYRSELDANNSNPYCYARWMSPDVDEKFESSTFPAEERHGHTVINWNGQWSSLRRLLEENIGSKPGWLDRATSTVQFVRQINEQLPNDVEEGYRSVDLDDMEAVVERWEGKIRTLYLEWGDSPVPPNECNELDLQIEVLLTHLDNLVLDIRNDDLAPDRKRGSIRSRIMKLRETLRHIDYEMEHV